MRTDDWNARVIGKASNEGFQEVPDRLERLDYSSAEGEGLDATLGNVSLSLRRAHVELNPLSTAEEEHFGVGNLGVSEEDGVAAEERLGLPRRDIHLELRV